MPDRMTQKGRILHALLAAENRTLCRSKLEEQCKCKRVAARVNELRDDGWVFCTSVCPHCAQARYYMPHTEPTLPARVKVVGVEVVVDNRVGLDVRMTDDVRDNYSAVQVDTLESWVRATIQTWMLDNNIPIPDQGEPLELMHSEDAIDIDALLAGTPEPPPPEAMPEPRDPEDEVVDVIALFGHDEELDADLDELISTI